MSGGLKRHIGLPLLVLYGLGTVVGVGIYAVIGEIAASAGAFTPVSFAIAAAIATFTALSLAELSARYPESAGEAAYVSNAFGSSRLTMLTGLIVIISGVVSAATIVRGATPYVQDFITLPDLPVMIILAVVLCSVASLGVRESASVAATISVIEIIGLLLVIVSGWGNIGTVHQQIVAHEHSFPTTAVLSGALLAFYAFIGFEDMVNMAEEVKDPARNMPRAILCVLCIAGALYISLALVLVSAVDPAVLAESPTPLALVFEETSGMSGRLISGIGILAIANGGLVQIIMVARVMYGMARRSILPAPLAKLNKVTHTPVLATCLASGMVLTLALIGSLSGLATLTSMLLLSVFTLVNAALIRIKKKHGPVKGAPDYPIAIPWIGTIVSIGFIAWKLGELLLK